MNRQFLPINKQDMEERNIEQLDFIIVTGDAYVDHPSFGAAVIGRLLEANGFTVGVIAQPNWKDAESISVLGEPQLGFLVTGGNIDSMVNHYTVAKKMRQTDAYSPGGKMGLRPDRASIVYGNMLRKAYKHTPIIIGGIEASLRRLAHYDYWDNKVRKSLLLDASADLIVFGMGELAMIQIADSLKAGIQVKDITFVPGTVYKSQNIDHLSEYILLPSYEEIETDKIKYAKSFMEQYTNTDPFNGKILVEKYGAKEWVVQNIAAPPMEQGELDRVYAYPYMKTYHPIYNEAGGIPAIEEIKFSIISNRGCFGGCNFCALTFHQGRIVQSRSHESIIREAEQLVWEPDFKGYINDVGGPTANFRKPSCQKQLTKGVCKNKQCLFPGPCSQLDIDHEDYIELLRKLRSIPKIKKVFIRSGVRYDYAIMDDSHTFIKELCQHHVSGQLKVAPEHISNQVLDLMGKPRRGVYEKFVQKYKEINQQLGMNQFLVPYLMSSHPGSTLHSAIELAEYLRDIGFIPQQVQDFYPTPSTLSTCMYYTDMDPRTMKKVYVPKTPHEKAMQRALIQFKNPNNYKLVVEALEEAQRTDLIGFGPKCLIKPLKGQTVKKFTQSSLKSDDNVQAVNKSNQSMERVETKYKKKTIRNIHKKKR